MCEKKWQPIMESCDHCGGDVAALTDNPPVGNHGDHARCMACSLPGTVAYEQDGESRWKQPWPWVAWHDIDECDGKCDWCKEHKHEWE